MNLTDILDKSCIAVPLRAAEKIDAITELIELLDKSGQLSTKDEVLDAILTRERTRSTGIGLGLAVPHGKSHGCKSLVMAVGKPAQPMAFDSVDGKPVQFIILLASPFDKTGPHIQALAGVSRLWQNEVFRTQALRSATDAEVYAAFEQFQE